jgi:4-amino-4-deoxy-L-arabinose transferase-like glycosyltransferase
MRNHSQSSWAILSVGIAAIVHFALGFSIEFSVDEAHYILYAQHLALSYFDHPPLVGWIQWPMVMLTQSEGLIRIIPELLWILSVYLVYQVTVEMYRWMQAGNIKYATSVMPSANQCGLLAVLAIIAAPLPHVLAIGLLPDTLLAPISLAIMMMALRWLRKDQFSILDWIVLGVLLGLAGLSKYTAAFTAFAFLGVLLITPKKPWLTKNGFWLAAVIALVLISPVLYWNFVNDWISFKYQLAHGGGSSWAWRRVAAYLGIQVACFGPLLILGAILFFKNGLTSHKRLVIVLFGFFAIPFLIFTALSGGGGLPHWTTPAWFCLAPFAGIGLAQAWANHRRWAIRILITIQLLLCMIGFAYVLAGGINSSSIKSNPIADLYGWKLAGQEAAKLAQANKVSGIAVQNWTLGSRTAWYAQPLPVFVLDQRQDQFDLWFGKLAPGSNVILVSWSGMPFSPPISKQNGFESCKPLNSLAIIRLGRILSTFDFSLCSNWQDSE